MTKTQTSNTQSKQALEAAKTQVMTIKEKVITLSVVGLVSAVAITITIALAWTLSIIFGH